MLWLLAGKKDRAKSTVSKLASEKVIVFASTLLLAY
jgi:hypothetical protein